MIEKSDNNGIHILNNYVAVIPVSYDEVSSSSFAKRYGIEKSEVDGHGDLSYRETSGIDLWCRVVGVGNVGMINALHILGYYVEERVVVGDLVLVKWEGLEGAMGEGLKKCGEVDCYYIDYGDIVVREGLDGYELLNGSVLVSRDSNVKSEDEFGIVLETSTDVIKYMSYPTKFRKSVELKPLEINVGDTVLMRKNTMRMVDYNVENGVYFTRHSDILLNINGNI